MSKSRDYVGWIKREELSTEIEEEEGTDFFDQFFSIIFYVDILKYSNSYEPGALFLIKFKQIQIKRRKNTGLK